MKPGQDGLGKTAPRGAVDISVQDMTVQEQRSPERLSRFIGFMTVTATPLHF